MGEPKAQNRMRTGHEPVRANAAETLRTAPVKKQHDEAAPKKQAQKTQAQKTRAKPAESRRVAERRSLSRDKKPKRDPAFSRQAKNILPIDWWVTSLAILFCVPAAALLARTVPSVWIICVAIVGAAIGFASKRFAIRERESKSPSRSRVILAWACIAIPPVSYGVIFGLWAAEQTLGWPWIIAAILAFNVMCSSILSGRTVQQAVCVVGSWSAAALCIVNLEIVLALLFATLSIALVGHYQGKINQSREEIEQARERERNRAEDILRDYEETGLGWFWETDRRGLLSYVSPSIIKVLHQDESQIIGRPFTDLFDLGDEGQEGERTLAFHMSARSSFLELGVRAATPGEERWWSINGRPAYDSFRNFVGFRGSGTDLTEKKRSEESVTRLAQYDSLTGLANRFQMQQTLEKILASPQEQQRECSVFLLDLDRFKHVNDTLGHPAGDALLKQVSQRLKRAVGAMGRVGRLGGDEFKVVILGRVERDQLGQLAHEIIHSLSQPYSIEGQRVVIGASIGIAISPDDGVTSEALIRNSDLALYAAKDGGRGRYHFYSNDLHAAAEARSKMEEDLRDAIANGDLQLFYQPVVYAKDNRIAGFEALLRWNHPVKGWLSPAKFVPIAEDTGLIAAIGEWAIRTACSDLARWPDHIRCAVNVSPLQFANPQLPAIVTNALARSGVDPARLELEITESVFLNDDEGTDAMFTALKRVGVRLALDDFGTGYSSLGYLKKAPFDKIKIDQSFVRGATQPGSRNGAIITSITSLAESLGMDTTAEGVETLDELELVRALGCSHIQGYIYAKAMSCEAATAQLMSGDTMTPTGPKSSRPPRQKMLRKVMLEHAGNYYNGTIRNIGVGGAMIEGLWNVPPGTVMNLAMSAKDVLQITTIWSRGDQMGVQFSQPIDLEKHGVAGVSPAATSALKPGDLIRKSA